MAPRLVTPEVAHRLATLGLVDGYRTQRELRRDRDASRRFDDEQGISGESAFTVHGKPLIVQAQQNDALRIRQEGGLTQVLFGTQGNANGNADPIFLIGDDITDIFTYRFKIFGGDGHAVASAGFPMFRSVNQARRPSGVSKDVGATTMTTWGTTAWTVGTMTSGDTTTDNWGIWTTAASVGSANGPNGPQAYLSSWKVEAFFRILMGTSIANQRVWIGLFSGDPSASSTPNLHFAGFRYVAGTDTNWLAYTGDGSSRTNANTQVAVNADQAYNMTVRLYPTFAQMVIGLPGFNDGVVNGTWAQTITTTLPSTTQLLSPFVRITNITSNQAVAIKFAHAQFLQGANWFS